VGLLPRARVQVGEELAVRVPSGSELVVPFGELDLDICQLGFEGADAAMELIDVVGSTEAGLPPGLFAHQLRETTFETLNVGHDGGEVGFDLAVVVPSFRGAAYVGRSPGLGNDRDFIEVDTKPLQSPAHPNLFAIGDAADLPTSKTGSVAHFEGEIVVHNIRRFLAGESPDAHYDGHGTGFIETGFHKAMLLDSNYTTQPLPGHFPTAVGLPLLKDSRLSHLAKVEFQWFYWHFLLPGRDIPGLGSAMPTRGKARVADLDAEPGSPPPSA